MLDGVFNTIQPRGLANIARKYNLSWQECAQAVGVSPFELYDRGYIDGIIDYTPANGTEGLENLTRAVHSSVLAIENLATHFVATNDKVLEHYHRTVRRFIEPSRRLREQRESGTLSTVDDPTSQPNVFGVAYRYLRYLGLRKRVSSTTVERYGRLATTEIPSGDLQQRTEIEHRQAFERWHSNPLQVKYDDVLNSVWKSYVSARAVVDRDRGRVASFLFGSRQPELQARSVQPGTRARLPPLQSLEERLAAQLPAAARRARARRIRAGTRGPGRLGARDRQ